MNPPGFKAESGDPVRVTRESEEGGDPQPMPIAEEQRILDLYAKVNKAKAAAPEPFYDLAQETSPVSPAIVAQPAEPGYSLAQEVSVPRVEADSGAYDMPQDAVLPAALPANSAAGQPAYFLATQEQQMYDVVEDGAASSAPRQNVYDNADAHEGYSSATRGVKPSTTPAGARSDATVEQPLYDVAVDGPSKAGVGRLRGDEYDPADGYSKAGRGVGKLRGDEYVVGEGPTKTSLKQVGKLNLGAFAAFGEGTAVATPEPRRKVSGRAKSAGQPSNSPVAARRPSARPANSPGTGRRTSVRPPTALQPKQPQPAAKKGAKRKGSGVKAQAPAPSNSPRGSPKVGRLPVSASASKLDLEYKKLAANANPATRSATHAAPVEAHAQSAVSILRRFRES